MDFAEIKKEYLYITLPAFICLWMASLIPVISMLFTLKAFTFAGIFKFYPVFFIFLFYKYEKASLQLSDYFEIIIYLAILISAKLCGVLSGVWIASLSIGLLLLKTFGFNFHFLGRMLFFLIPPFNEKISLIFGFDLRLMLTKTAGFALRFIDSDTAISGNLLIFRGNEFTVAPACEGLKMGAGLLIFLFIFIYNLNKKYKFGFKAMLIYSLLSLTALITWIASNLVRIIILVAFDIKQDSVFHYITGLILLLTMSAVPIYIVYSFFSGKKNNIINAPDKAKKHITSMIVSFASIAAVLIICIFIKTPVNVFKFDFPVNIAGFTRSYMIETKSAYAKDYEIAVYNKDGMSLILKNNLYPLRIIHNPRQCWTGEGYKIIKEQTIDLGQNGAVQELQISKDKKISRLYFWYQPVNTSEGKITHSEIIWRINTLFKKINYIQYNLFTDDDYSDYLLTIDSLSP